MDRKRIIAWSAFLSVAMWVAVVNFEKFASRPPSPSGWIDSRTREAQALAVKIDNEPEAARRDDFDQYCWLLLESGQRKQAHDIAAAISPPRPSAAGYDAEYAQRLMRLATAELMHDCVEDMLTTFHHLYEYDRQHLPAGDIRCIRDLNNMGLACLLVGQNSNDEAFRATTFNQARLWLAQAEENFPPSAKGDLLSVKENQLMLAEALKDRRLADSCRRRIESLLAQINGPAPRVSL